MNKWLLIGSMISIVFVLFLGKGLLFEMYSSGPLHHIKSFEIFYGKPDRIRLKELSSNDAVILEPTAFNEEEISILKNDGVTLFGYVSLVQLENWNEELKKHISNDDYLMFEGKHLYIKEWDTYVMDLRSASYREALLWKIQEHIINKGLDGVFFDTVDDLDYHFRDDSTTRQEMLNGYEQVLLELKHINPELLIIQNRGFETYRNLSSHYVDGLLWEGFRAEDMKESEWAKKWLNYFKKKQRNGSVTVLTVVEDEKSRKLSEMNRFPAFLRTGDTYE